jgi:EAL domain-containing protein (putative c-di-GMP-specific phosphodiesterase class I)
MKMRTGEAKTWQQFTLNAQFYPILYIWRQKARKHRCDEMILEPGKVKIDATAGFASPFGAAIGGIDRDTITMVGDALAQRRMRLAYQPIVTAAAPNQVAFYEGLIRILDPNHRVIPAKDFMGVVENTDMGRQIDCVALAAGLRALAAHPHLRLSINMSARSIGYPAWITTLRQGLAQDNSLGARLILEISESSAMLVPEIVVAFMDEFQREGIAIALDNFGSGHMAVRYFREFMFDIVKIDRQFIRDIDAHSENQNLVAALISMAKHFSMYTVAEAVETPAEAAVLQRLGVDCFQGFLFGAPSMKTVFA